MSETDYYSVRPESDLHKEIEEFILERKESHAKRVEFRDRFGADGLYGTDAQTLGLVFNDAEAKANVPTGFRHKSGDPDSVFRPNKKTVEGKAIASEMEALRMPGAMEFHLRLFKDCPSFGIRVGPGNRGGGFAVRFITYDIVAGEKILCVPRNQDGEIEWKPDPKDATPLKLSEYYAKKEALELKEVA